MFSEPPGGGGLKPEGRPRLRRRHKPFPGIRKGDMVGGGGGGGGENNKRLLKSPPTGAARGRAGITAENAGASNQTGGSRLSQEGEKEGGKNRCSQENGGGEERQFLRGWSKGQKSAGGLFQDQRKQNDRSPEKGKKCVKRSSIYQGRSGGEKSHGAGNDLFL